MAAFVLLAAFTIIVAGIAAGVSGVKAEYQRRATLRQLFMEEDEADLMAEIEDWLKQQQ